MSTTDTDPDQIIAGAEQEATEAENLVVTLEEAVRSGDEFFVVSARMTVVSPLHPVTSKWTRSCTSCAWVLGVLQQVRSSCPRTT